MDNQPSGVSEHRRSVSRRDALKRGAMAGGALLWVTPAVQVIGLGRANAQAASGKPAFLDPPPPSPKEKTEVPNRPKKGEGSG